MSSNRDLHMSTYFFSEVFCASEKNTNTGWCQFYKITLILILYVVKKQSLLSNLHEKCTFWSSVNIASFRQSTVEIWYVTEKSEYKETWKTTRRQADWNLNSWTVDSKWVVYCRNITWALKHYIFGVEIFNLSDFFAIWNCDWKFWVTWNWRARVDF